MNNKITYIDITNKTYKEIILDKKSFNGFKITDNNVYKLSLYDISLLWEILFPKKSMTRIDTYLDYDVYYDEENQLKHFIKNGEENYELFLQLNGTPALVYLDTQNDKDKRRKDRIKKYKLKFKNGIIIADVIGILLCLNMLGFYYYPYFESKISDIDSYIEQIHFNKITDIEEAKEYIYQSEGLNDEQKDLLFNEELFNMILPYYKGTPMEYLINERLKNITVEYYVEADRPEVAGYYAGENVLYIKNGCEKFSLGHEMTHLLQNPLCQRHFFIESMADMIQKEFYNSADEGYPLENAGLRLLIETIGPKPIWEYVFGGDFTSIEEILTTNLAEQDYSRMMEILNSDTLDENSYNDLIQLISVLYKNIYHDDINNNRDIFDISGKLIDKVYFNEQKMPKYNEATVSDFLIPNEHFIYKEAPLVPITKEEAIKLRKEGYIVKSSLIPTSGATNPIMSGSDAKTRENMISFKYNDELLFMKESEAIENGYFTRQYELVLDEKAKANLNYTLPEKYEMCSYPTLDIQNYTMEIKDDTTYYTFYSKNIKDRFPDQDILKKNNHFAFNKE